MSKPSKNENKGNSKPNSSNRRHTNNRRGGNKPKPVKGKEEESKVQGSQGDINDPSYYYTDGNVLDQVMNFSFNEYGGIPVEMNLDGSGNTVNYNNNMLATYWVNPSVPETNDSSLYGMDGTQTASLRNFITLSAGNGKTTMYPPQLVTILMLAIAEILKAKSFIERIFGWLYLFNYRNRTIPDKVLLMMGIDPADFQRNAAAYRVRFNKLITMAQQICFPSNVRLFAKAEKMFSFVYLDDPNSALAQMYMLCPASTWIFDEIYDTNGPGLVTTQLTGTPQAPKTLNDVLNTFEQMISQLLTSSSLNLIYSDIMRCVQKGYINNLLTFTTIPEGYVNAPVYSEEVRDWLHNATIMGTPLDFSDIYNPTGVLDNPVVTPMNDVQTDTGTNKVKYHPQFALPANALYSRLIDFNHDGVSLEDKVRATRLSQRCTAVLDSQANRWYSNELALNDNYITKVTFTADGINFRDITSNANPMPSSATVAIREADAITKFDWAPLMYYYSVNASNIITDVRIVGDLDYYTQLEFPVLKRIYDYEIISLLQIG